MDIWEKHLSPKRLSPKRLVAQMTVDRPIHTDGRAKICTKNDFYVSFSITFDLLI